MEPLVDLYGPELASDKGKDSLFFLFEIGSVSGVPGLCFGVLCDLTFALADSVDAM